MTRHATDDWRVAVDAAGIVVDGSPSFARGLGATPASLIGSSLEDGVSATWPGCLGGELAEALGAAGATIGPFDRWLVGADGVSVAMRLWLHAAGPDRVEITAVPLNTFEPETHRLALEAIVLGWIAAGARLRPVLGRIASLVDALVPGARASVGEVDGEQVHHRSAAPGTLAAVHGLPVARQIPSGSGAIVDHDGVWVAPVRVGARVAGSIVVLASGVGLDGHARTVVRRGVDLAALAITRSHADRAAIFHADHDPLTGLPNRESLSRQLAAVLAEADDSADAVAVIGIDLDRFRLLHDLVGQAAADDVLREAATALTHACRPHDVVSRSGGNEFTVLVRVADGHDAQARAEVLAAAIPLHRSIGGVDVATSVSVGIAMAWADVDASTLMEQVATALHQAKANGGGTIAWFDPEIRRSQRERVQFAGALRQGIQDRELEVHYQPILHLDGAGVAGAEALVRWRRGGEDLVPPSDFVPIAEDLGLIDELGLDVLAQAMEVTAELRRTGWPDFVMSVNVSARQLQGDLVSQVAGLLVDQGLNPAGLNLEITEGVLVRSGADSVVHGLHLLGVGITIDDFGTGYSSLGYLRRYPVASGLKIDASFVRDLGAVGTADDDGTARAIVTAATVLGHSLGMHVTAEGVERQAQLDAVTELGCDRVQGFLVSRPVAAAELARRLSEVAVVAQSR